MDDSGFFIPNAVFKTYVASVYVIVQSYAFGNISFVFYRMISYAFVGIYCSVGQYGVVWATVYAFVAFAAEVLGFACVIAGEVAYYFSEKDFAAERPVYET